MVAAYKIWVWSGKWDKSWALPFPTFIKAVVGQLRQRGSGGKHGSGRCTGLRQSHAQCMLAQVLSSEQGADRAGFVKCSIKGCKGRTNVECLGCFNGGFTVKLCEWGCVNAHIQGRAKYKTPQHRAQD